MGRFYSFKYIYYQDEIEFKTIKSLSEFSNISTSTIRKMIKKGHLYKNHFYTCKIKVMEELKGFYYSIICSNGERYRSISDIRRRLPMTRHYRPYEEGILKACLYGGSYYGYKWKEEKIYQGFKYTLTK